MSVRIPPSRPTPPQTATTTTQLTLGPGDQVHSAAASNFVYCSDAISLMQRPRTGSGNWLTRFVAGQGVDDVFINATPDLLYVALSIPHVGKIVPVELRPGGVALLVSTDCYLASQGPTTHQRMVLQAGVVAEPLPMQKISVAPGPPVPGSSSSSSSSKATVFLQPGGTVVAKKLREGEAMYCHTACIAALTEGVTVHPPVQGAPVAVPGGGAHYYRSLGPMGWTSKAQTACIVKGPGTVYISSLPLPRVARHLVTAQGGAADALVVVKLARLFLFLLVLGAIGGLLQIIAFDFDQLEL